MVIKVNKITNLQDARYCAALGVGCLTFSIERGDIAKLPEHLIAEIAGWVSGPELYLDAGTDYDNAINLKSFAAQNHLGLSATFSVGMPSGLNPVFIFSEPDITDLPKWVEATGKANFGEIIPMQLNDVTLKNLNTVFKQLDNTFLNIDFLPDWQFALQRLDYLPAGISLQKCVALDAFNLDYDKFENCLRTLTVYWG